MNTFLYGSGEVIINEQLVLSQASKALLIAVVAKLQGAVGTNSQHKFMSSRWITIQPDSKVPPTAAERAISVYQSAFGSVAGEGPTRKEEYEVTIAFTARKKGIPSDARGVDLVTDIARPTTISMAEVTEAIIEAIDGRLDVVLNANDLITKGNPFSTRPLFLRPNTDLTPREVGPEHFYTQPTSKGQQRSVENLEGYLVEIPFGGAWRFRNTFEY